MTGEVLRLARLIWDYHQLGHEPIPADAIVALGTHDLRVAGHAADLFHRGYGSTLICTGGVAHRDDLLASSWEESEAERFAAAAVRRGVPPARILLETRATNTAENFRFTRELLAARGLRPRNIVIAVKPFMQRRAWATLAVEWPEMPASLASPRLTLEEYFTPELPPERVISIMLGDLQRLWVYARKGWSAPQRVPDEVLEAFRRLSAMGFTAHLVPE